MKIEFFKHEGENTAMGRLERMCKAFVEGTVNQQSAILTQLNDEEKEIFGKACFFYRLQNDEQFRNDVMNYMGERWYHELRGEVG